MKKQIIILCAVILLAGCERPATISNWSPINDISTPGPTSTLAILDHTPQSTPTASLATLEAATPFPTLDLNQFPNLLPESMKGYELVSWQMGDKWNFTLITGTNRSKSFEELMSPESSVSNDGFVKITVSGIDEIKKVLALLPAKSEVLWSGMDLSGLVPDGTIYLAYPEQSVKDDLVAFCAKHDVALEIQVEPGK